MRTYPSLPLPSDVPDGVALERVPELGREPQIY
jgi:hypothetical protein